MPRTGHFLLQLILVELAKMEDSVRKDTRATGEQHETIELLEDVAIWLVNDNGGRYITSNTDLFEELDSRQSVFRIKATIIRQSKEYFMVRIAAMVLGSLCFHPERTHVPCHFITHD